MLFYLKQKTFIVKSYKMLDAGLYIVATPIGNIRDLSPRGIDVLQDAEIIAAEDTRISKKLFSLLGISTHKFFITYEDHSEQEKDYRFYQKRKKRCPYQRRRFPAYLRPRI